MTDENENRPTRTPLTLKPRTGSSVSTGTVKQSFSHGRTKTVVVETKRPRLGASNLAAPSLAEKRPPAFDVRGPAPQRQGGPSGADPHALSEAESLRRQKVAAEFARQQAERAAAEARTREAAAAARAPVAEPVADPAEAAPEAPRAEAPVEAPAPVAAAPVEAAPEPPPGPVQAEAPAPAEAFEPRAEAPRAPVPTQTRTYDP